MTPAPSRGNTMYLKFRGTGSPAPAVQTGSNIGPSWWIQNTAPKENTSTQIYLAISLGASGLIFHSDCRLPAYDRPCLRPRAPWYQEFAFSSTETHRTRSIT